MEVFVHARTDPNSPSASKITMLSKPTVIILGAGASMPYGFPSGEKLLRDARMYPVQQLASLVKPGQPMAVPALHRALQGTLDRSIDAMLETLPKEVVDAGKAYMARTLLACEANARTNPAHWGHYDQEEVRALACRLPPILACDQRTQSTSSE
jgi:hypothetical protein